MAESESGSAPGNSPATRESPWPVGLMSEKIAAWVDRLGQVWVEGEVTQWQVRGGHVYGKLKDLGQDATVSFTVWRSVAQRLSSEFAQGDRVIALVKPNFWVKGGSLTVQVFDLSHVGLGELLERLERLRRQLQSEGLFDPARKRTLPFLPGKIGLVTGRDSDAEKDVVRNATLRWPGVQFKIHYAAVQGDRAATEVAAGIEALDQDPTVDVIIVARGGGDFQNLLPFSDERVVRAAAAATTPVVSAIGHEADRPLLDEVADLRASTPTDAAKRVVPDVGEELAGIDQARARMSSRLGQLLSYETDRISQLRGRPVLRTPERIVDERAEELVRWIARGTELADRAIVDRSRSLTDLRARLTSLSPQATLERGYGIVQLAHGAVLRDAGDAPAGTPIRISLAAGKLAAVSEGSAGPAPK
ncbi:exodeoxyribonuclease VII large subunit [Leucobacter luti]|uniref:exodeoxyribonuclease VII large subunit n=1 Tax=Leucobacter luti TaxID=340320 RepID=UPI0010536777|nr:exodeoxyribonuclease VII large subunit [Leucobacter luti]MCW2288498.1 exodeoxyribonuclease VII large subunit [Leucobacter luti]TCK45346.1 exodeoxyribonuclease VII large subunit [Leucobacter luti]